MKLQIWLLAAALAVGTAQAASQEVDIHMVDTEGKQQAIGSIQISETEHGLLFTPELTSLPRGVHGFHVHENGSCDPAEKDGKTVPAQAAGGDYDLQGTGKICPWRRPLDLPARRERDGTAYRCSPAHQQVDEIMAVR